MYFVFDVEALGLYGLGFSVGWVVVDEEGRELDEGYLACPYHEAMHSGTRDEDVKWAEANVVPHLPEPNCEALPHVYERFWSHWSRWKARGAYMVSDVSYPVESNFLRACILDDHERADDAPYPLLDVSSILFANGYDEIGTYERKASELPAHHPVNDARQSARIFLSAMVGALEG